MRLISQFQTLCHELSHGDSPPAQPHSVTISVLPGALAVLRHTVWQLGFCHEPCTDLPVELGSFCPVKFKPSNGSFVAIKRGNLQMKSSVTGSVRKKKTPSL